MTDLPREERRLILRVRERWERAGGERAFPRACEMTPALFADDWPHCYLLDVRDQRDPSFSYIGSAFAFAGRRFSECPLGTLLRSAAGSFPQAIARRVPVVFMGSGRSGDYPVLLRAILLPLSSDGVAIDALLGAANCRLLAREAPLPA